MISASPIEEGLADRQRPAAVAPTVETIVYQRAIRVLGHLSAGDSRTVADSMGTRCGRRCRHVHLCNRSSVAHYKDYLSGNGPYHINGMSRLAFSALIVCVPTVCQLIETRLYSPARRLSKGWLKANR